MFYNVYEGDDLIMSYVNLRDITEHYKVTRVTLFNHNCYNDVKCEHPATRKTKNTEILSKVNIKRIPAHYKEYYTKVENPQRPGPRPNPDRKHYIPNGRPRGRPKGYKQKIVQERKPRGHYKPKIVQDGKVQLGKCRIVIEEEEPLSSSPVEQSNPPQSITAFH